MNVRRRAAVGFVAVAAVVSACGTTPPRSAPISSTRPTTADPSPSTSGPLSASLSPTSAPLTSVASSAATAGVADVTSALTTAPIRAGSETLARLPAPTLVTSADGVALLGTDGHVVYQVAPAIASADGRVVVSATLVGPTTRVRVHDPSTGAVTNTFDVRGDLVPAAIGAGHVALVEPVPTVDAIGSPPGLIAPARTKTRVAVADIGGKQARTFDLVGNFMPEAFGSSDSDALVLLEYLPAERPTSYRVRTLSLTEGRLDFPWKWNTKEPVDEQMQGVARTHVLDPAGNTLYTLYRAVPASGRAGHAFIHTLGLNVPEVFCLDLPDDLGFATAPGALSTGRDGTHLYALNTTGRLADIAVISAQFGNGTSDPLSITRSVNLGVGAPANATKTGSGSSPTSVSLTTTKDALWATVGATLVKVDPVTLTVIERSSLPSPATAVAVFDDVAMVAGATNVQQRSGAGVWTTVATLPAAVSSPIGLQPLD